MSHARDVREVTEGPYVRKYIMLIYQGFLGYNIQHTTACVFLMVCALFATIFLPQSDWGRNHIMLFVVMYVLKNGITHHHNTHTGGAQVDTPWFEPPPTTTTQTFQLQFHPQKHF